MAMELEGDQVVSPYLRPTEAALYLRISLASVYRLIKNGELPARKFGPKGTRVHRDELSRFEESRRLSHD